MDKKLWIGAAAVLLVGIVGSVVGLVVHMRSPAYALGQVKKALVTHDRALFYKYVDVDSLLARAADDVAHSEQSGSDEMAEGMLAVLKPTLVKSFREQIDRAIDGGAAPQAQALRTTFDEVFSSPPVSIKTNGSVATVVFHIRLRHAKTDSRLVLGLHQSDGHLKFCEISNLSQLIKDAGQFEHDWKMDQNIAVYRKFKKAVQFESFEYTPWDDPNWGENYFVFTAKVKNDSDQVARKIRARVYFRDNNKRLLEADDLYFSKGSVPPHSTKTLSFRRDERATAADRALHEHSDRYHVSSLTPFSVVLDGQLLAMPFPEDLTE